MIYAGQRMTVGDLLAEAHAAPPPSSEQHAHISLRHTAAGNASACAALIAQGDDLDQLWRYIILQSLDDYASTLRRGGPRLAAHFFDDEPAPTGSPHIDAALAALADHLATRDAWTIPAWAHDPSRTVDAWYPDVPAHARLAARTQSPPAFRRRGIYLTSRSLERA